jgi:aspartyl-tRNA(Asn)/glutamyl-tRNA(Gln) amidotransferase subunit B
MNAGATEKNGWETVIGLEIHAQLSTKTKIFSGSPTAYGAAPNSQANLVDLAYPGVLPVLNQEVVRMAVKFGLAVGATIATRSVFARKNYFYPDLPKGYQISQYELPIVAKGTMEIVLDDGSRKTIGITRAHLEEDAGKSLHEGLPKQSGIDLNRAGTPLIEIVSEPDMRSAKEAVAYLKKVHTLVRYLEICDGNMQEGSFRCDANVSVRRFGAEKFGTRAEIKNINSFRYVEKAINYEVARQIDVIEGGGKVVQETRLYDPDKGETRSMRSKEDAHDYRYFPDPDLLPLELTDEEIERIRATLPELPDQKRARFVKDYGLKEYDANLLASDAEKSTYFEAVAKGRDARLAANWVTQDLLGYLNKEGLELSQSTIKADQLGGLIALIADNTISGKIAKDVFAKMIATGDAANVIVEREGLKQVTDTGAIEKVIDEVIAANPKQVQEIADQRAAGHEKPKTLGWLVGQIMKASGGKANPAALNEILLKKLGL